MMADPEKAAATIGYSLTQGQVSSLKESEIGKISEELSSRISKAGHAGHFGVLGAFL